MFGKVEIASQDPGHTSGGAVSGSTGTCLRNKTSRGETRETDSRTPASLAVLSGNQTRHPPLGLASQRAPDILEPIEEGELRANHSINSINRMPPPFLLFVPSISASVRRASVHQCIRPSHHTPLLHPAPSPGLKKKQAKTGETGESSKGCGCPPESLRTPAKSNRCRTGYQFSPALKTTASPEAPPLPLHVASRQSSSPAWHMALQPHFALTRPHHPQSAIHIVHAAQSPRPSIRTLDSNRVSSFMGRSALDRCLSRHPESTLAAVVL